MDLNKMGEKEDINIKKNDEMKIIFKIKYFEKVERDERYKRS